MSNRTGAFFSGVADTLRQPWAIAESLANYGLGNKAEGDRVLREGPSILPNWYNQYANQLKVNHPGYDTAGSIVGGGLSGVMALKNMATTPMAKGLFNTLPQDFRTINQYGRQMTPTTAAIIGGAGSVIQDTLANKIK